MKHGRHGMQHNAIVAVSIVRKFCRVRRAVRTTASSSSDNNIACHWQDSASGHGTHTLYQQRHTRVPKKTAVGHAQRSKTRCAALSKRTDGR